jgi:hypothetical protein
MTTPPTDRAYCVHALHDTRDHAREVRGQSFEAAALAFVEDWHPAPDDDMEGGGDVSLIVRDQQTGREQCFRVDLGAGEAAPCG